MVSLHILGTEDSTNIHSVALSTGGVKDIEGEWRLYRDTGKILMIFGIVMHRAGNDPGSSIPESNV